MDKLYKTAISRKKISAPVRWLLNNKKLGGKNLDYGCGKSIDWIITNSYRYDPHYQPIKPKGKFDNIFCTYVLCIVSKKEQTNILKDIKSKLKVGGKAYITVRRDLAKKGYKSSLCHQKYIILDMPVVYKNSNYCIYKMEK